VALEDIQLRSVSPQYEISSMNPLVLW